MRGLVKLAPLVAMAWEFGFIGPALTLLVLAWP